MAEERSIAGGSTRLEASEIPWLLASVLLVNAIGAAPALVAGPNSPWFQALSKPSIYPPGWTFGVVWTLLFTVLGVALYLIVRAGLQTRAVRLGVGLFVVQMAVNVSWTLAFFGLEDVGLGLAVIVLLWLLVVPMTALFWRIRRVAALLVVPYVLWITFAALLNYRFLVLN